MIPNHADFSDMLAHWVRERPAATALEFGDTRLSWTQLAERVHRVAAGLRASGLKPDDRIARAVIRGCGGVLAVTSANRHGQAPCTSAEAVAAEFGPGLIVLDGGSRDGGVASTVVDASGDAPRILREGPITAADLGIGS